MNRLQISDRELIAVLRRMAPETGSLLCLGCGHERSCSIHGCAVLRMAADRLKELAAPPPNPPLTLEELWEMDGEPVYLTGGECWVLVAFNGFASVFHWPDGSSCSAADWCNNVGPAYRRKPEEGTA